MSIFDAIVLHDTNGAPPELFLFVVLGVAAFWVIATVLNRL